MDKHIYICIMHTEECKYIYIYTHAYTTQYISTHAYIYVL